jgi:hypothetical protein
MRRREFFGVICGLAGAISRPACVASAQELGPPRLGVILQGGPWYAVVDGLRQGLKQLGLVEGKQFVLDIFSVNRLGRFRESEILRHIFERVVAACMAAGLVPGKSVVAFAD